MRFFIIGNIMWEKEDTFRYTTPFVEKTILSDSFLTLVASVEKSW